MGTSDLTLLICGGTSVTTGVVTCSPCATQNSLSGPFGSGTHVRPGPPVGVVFQTRDCLVHVRCPSLGELRGTLALASGITADHRDFSFAVAFSRGGSAACKFLFRWFPSALL